MALEGKLKGRDNLTSIISSDESLEEYYNGLPEEFKDKIKKKAGLIKSSEDLYQMIDCLIQSAVDDVNV